MGFGKKFFSRKAEGEAERSPALKQQQSVQGDSPNGDSKTTISPGNQRDQSRSVDSAANHVERQQNDEHRRKLAQLEAQIQDMSADKEQSAGTISDLTSELHRQQDVSKQRANEIYLRDETIKGLQQDLSRMQEQKKELETVAIERQKDNLQSLVTNRWHAPKEDRYVRDELFKLGGKIRQWARSNSVTAFSDLDTVAASDKDQAVRYLSGYCAHLDWDTLISKFPVSKEKLPALLVQATLAKDLFGKLFTDPFFAFVATEGDKSVPGPEEMRTLQDSIAQVSESAAHVWRSQTIRGLSNTSNPTTTPFLAARIDPICSLFVADILSGSIRFLFRSGEDPAQSHNERFQELHSLYKGAAQLALTLWGQRASITVRTLQDLPPFTIASEEMGAHRLHHLDEDDMRLDGKEALLLLQPAILAFGSERADHYDQHKVWAPAVVLLDTK
ncbi:hypothetical protein BDV12DRAFT_30170 [Aspergillus spectabilis]